MPEFTYTAYGPFTKDRERIEKFRETGNLKILYRKESDKAGLALDTSYLDSKDLSKNYIYIYIYIYLSDKIFKDRDYEITGSRGYDGYQRGLASLCYKFVDQKNGSRGWVTSKDGIYLNEQLDKDLHKPVTKKFKRRKVYARFKDNIWAEDLAEIESLSSLKKNVKYSLCVIEVFINMQGLNL